MVSMMASGFKGPGLSPGLCHLCCVLGQDTLTLPLSGGLPAVD